MAHTTHTTRAPLLQRLLDGGRTWGAYEITTSRYGMTRHRLVVFPPGLSRDERLALRAWRSFPVWGLASWLVTAIVLMTTLTPVAALAGSTTLCLVAGAAALARAGHAHCNVRTLTVVRMSGVGDATAGRQLDELHALTEQLLKADAQRAAGELTVVGHEAEVWRVYAQLPSH
jgi:hypothetical protein